MITATVVAKAAAPGGLRASLTAILLSFGNWAGAFRVCAFVLVGHGISPVRLLGLPFFDAQVLKKVKGSGAYIRSFFRAFRKFGWDGGRSAFPNSRHQKLCCWKDSDARFENLDKSRLYVWSVPEVTSANPF